MQAAAVEAARHYTVLSLPAAIFCRSLGLFGARFSSL